MKAVVFGGGGFLGGAIARRLLVAGAHVRVFGRRRYPGAEAAGCECVQGDVTDWAAVRRACEGRDVAFHAAAKVGLWGTYEEFFRINVDGTKNVIHACHDAGVPKLVFTSSPSVVFDGKDCEGGNESLPYPPRFDSLYSRTKALAEQMVLAANGGVVATVALRPHLIWGPGDTNLLPRLLEKHHRLKRIGAFNKRVDTTYIDDAAEAHYLAAARLGPGSPAAGKAYFISQGDPRPIWFMINGLLAAAGKPPVTRQAPLWAANAAASLYEAWWTLRRRQDEPPLTRFLVAEMTSAHWFDISAARRDLGYVPTVKIEEGLERLKAWLRRRPAGAAA